MLLRGFDACCANSRFHGRKHVCTRDGLKGKSDWSVMLQGVGCASCTVPHLCTAEQKVMCIKSHCTGDLVVASTMILAPLSPTNAPDKCSVNSQVECCGPEGFIMVSQKSACLYQSCMLPPKACFCELLGCRNSPQKVLRQDFTCPYIMLRY